MKKYYSIQKVLQSCSLLLFVIIGINVSAQVGIGTITPNATLDITSTNDGILIPRVSLQSTTLVSINNPMASKLVYNTATVNDVTPGFYYLNPTATAWVRLATGAEATANWGLMGNTGTTASNFLGTVDDQSLSIKTSNAERIKVTNTGNVGIGVSNPNYKLEVSATSDPVKLTGLATGSPGDEIITVDINGVLKKRINGASSTTIAQSYRIPDNVSYNPGNPNNVTFSKVSIPQSLPNSFFSFNLPKNKSVIICYNISVDDFTNGIAASPYVHYEIYKNGVATGAQSVIQIPYDGAGLVAASFTLTFTESLTAGFYVYDVRARRINNVGFANDSVTQTQGVLSVYATATYVD